MRTLADRIRHTVFFEGIALLLIMVFGSYVTGHDMQSLGLIGIIMSLVAMAWNLAYNWLFDKVHHAYRPGETKTLGLRIVHAILFEAVLLLIGVFVVLTFLDITFMEALMLDIGFSVFFLIYAFIYNWLYDIIFPIQQPPSAGAAAGNDTGAV